MKLIEVQCTNLQRVAGEPISEVVSFVPGGDTLNADVNSRITTDVKAVMTMTINDPDMLGKFAAGEHYIIAIVPSTQITSLDVTYDNKPADDLPS